MKISNKFFLSLAQNFSISIPLSCKSENQFKTHLFYKNSATLSISKAILPTLPIGKARATINEKSKIGATRKNLTFKKTFAFANAKIKISQKYTPRKFTKAQVLLHSRLPVDPARAAISSKKNIKETLSYQSNYNTNLCKSLGPNNLFWGVLLFSRGDLAFVDLRGVLSTLLKALHACLFATLNNKRILFVADQTPLVQEHQQKLLCFFIGSQANSFSTKVTDKLPFETLKEKNPYFELSSDQISNTPKNLGQKKASMYSENNIKIKLVNTSKTGTSFSKQSNKVSNRLPDNQVDRIASPQGTQYPNSNFSKLDTKLFHLFNLGLLKNKTWNSQTLIKKSKGERFTCDSFSPTLYGKNTLLWGSLLSTSFIKSITQSNINVTNSLLKTSKKNLPILKDWLLCHSPDLLVKAHNPQELKTSSRSVKMLSHIALPFRNLLLQDNAKHNISDNMRKQHGPVKLYPKDLVTKNKTLSLPSCFADRQSIGDCVTRATSTPENTSLVPDPLFSRQVVKLIGKAAVRSSQWTFTLAQPTNLWVSGFFSNSFASYKQKLSSATLLGINISDAQNLTLDQKQFLPYLKLKKAQQEKQNRRSPEHLQKWFDNNQKSFVPNLKSQFHVKKVNVSDTQDYTELNIYNTKTSSVRNPFLRRSKYVKVLEKLAVNVKRNPYWLTKATTTNVSKQSKEQTLKSGHELLALLSQKRKAMSKNFFQVSKIYDELNKFAGGQEWQAIYYNPASRKDFVNKQESQKSGMYKRKKRLKSYTSNLSHKALNHNTNLFSLLTDTKNLDNQLYPKKNTLPIGKARGKSRLYGYVKTNNRVIFDSVRINSKSNRRSFVDLKSRKNFVEKDLFVNSFNQSKTLKKIKLYSKLLHHSIKCADSATRNPWLKEADLVFFANPEKTMSLLNQISRLKIPTIGIVNPGSILSKASFKSIPSYRILSGKPTITYPIIGNANSLNFLRLILTKLANIINAK